MSLFIDDSDKNQLSVNQLLEAEQLAKKSSQYDKLYIDTKDELLDEGDIEEPIDEEESDIEESDIEVTSEEDEESQELAQESIDTFKLLYSEPSLEDFDKVKDIAVKLGSLGISASKVLAKGLFKSVIYLMGKLLKLQGKAIKGIINYIDNELNGFHSIQNELISLEKQVQELDEVDLSEYRYTNLKVINHLKIGTSSSPLSVLKQFHQTVSQLTSIIFKSVNTELSKITYIISLSDIKNSLNKDKSITSLKDLSIKSNLTESTISGYEPVSDLITSYIYERDLPGDIKFILHLPSNDVDNVNDLVASYNSSKSILGFNESSFEVIEDINYMSKTELLEFIQISKSICDKCLQYESEYKAISKRYDRLKYSFKRYFINLIDKSSKVSLSDSYIDLIYLKYNMVYRVDLKSAMTFHKYANTVLVYSLRYMKDNIKQFQAVSK